MNHFRPTRLLFAVLVVSIACSTSGGSVFAGNIDGPFPIGTPVPDGLETIEPSPATGVGVQATPWFRAELAADQNAATIYFLGSAQHCAVLDSVEIQYRGTVAVARLMTAITAVEPSICRTSGVPVATTVRFDRVVNRVEDGSDR